MILHGIEAPNIKHMNTLAENINDIQEKDANNQVRFLDHLTRSTPKKLLTSHHKFRYLGQ